MDTFQPNPAGRQAYINRQLRARERGRGNMVFSAGQIVRETGGAGADLFRHLLTVVGVAGLVVIAVGATTDSPIYHHALNWITSFFL